MEDLGAVAVDLGASSARFAAGTVRDGCIDWAIVEQIPHSSLDWNGHAVWDIEKLLGLCRRAVDYARAHFRQSCVGIDSWGVDHGFIKNGKLIQPPICYRDLSHAREFEAMKSLRPKLFELTGIAHQPFNTIYQLAARMKENPNLAAEDVTWLNIPDLLGKLLGGSNHRELTMASTTQLVGLDSQWCEEIFELIGWPVPEEPPTKPGWCSDEIATGVRLAHVGSHDTASAIYGLGALPKGTMFLNTGTWSLAGVVIDRPIASPEAEAAGFTNERSVDGRVRFLKNIPGFYVINRLHDELGIEQSVPDWLASAEKVDQRIDLLHADLYNPASMPDAVSKLSGWTDASPAAWAGLALYSLTETIAAQIEPLEKLVGTKIDKIRLSGGGSGSHILCQSLADSSGRTILAGPSEATVLGNLALTLKAVGAFGADSNGVDPAEAAISSSAGLKEYNS